MKRLLAVVLLAPVAFVVVFLLLFVSPQAPTITTTNCTTSTATGKLSATQVASFAYTAGWRGADLVIATAITEPESGADSTAVQNGGPIGASLVGVGLWQVTPGTQADLDPATNAAHAFAKYRAAHGFSPWTTYVGGEYLAFMAWAAQGVAHMSAAGLSCQAAPASSAQLDASAAKSGQAVQEATPPGLPPTFDSYSWGECTYWVALHFPVPPYLGNAAEWWQSAAAHGLQEAAAPAQGDVVVYGAGGGYSDMGHVAYVLQVNPDGSFVVSEMNYLGLGIVDQRTSSMADVEGFIV